MKMKILVYICLAIVCSHCLLTVEGRRPTCPLSTHFTIFYPSNQKGKEACRICSICPPAHGLPIQCGNRVANGTSTECKPCANGTYSKKNDSSECKSCDKCEGRNVLQQCTPWENSKCGTCLPGFYLDPHVDDCKECFFCCDDVLEGDHLQECKDLGMPWNMQCEATDANRKCKLKALLLNSTTARPTATVSPLGKPTGAISSTGATIAPSDITTNNNSKLHHVPINETEVIKTSVGEDHSSSGGKWYKTAEFVAPVGVVAIIIIIAIISYFAVKKRRQSRHGDQVYNSVEQGERHTETTELEILGNNVSYHQNNVNGRTTPLLENQSIESGATNSVVNGRTTQFLENRSTDSSATSSMVNGSTTPLLYNQSTATSSMELLNANNEEATRHDNLNLDLLRIPEDRVVSDMEKLRDNNQVMLHSVQRKLDARETLQQKTWRGVGAALGVSPEDLDLIETCYLAQQSPTEALVVCLKNSSHGEPSMREFVRALITCGRGDVARIIINWPRWEITGDQ